MYSVLLGPREHHNVRTLEEYRRRHAQFIATKAGKGHRISVHQVPGEKLARVDAGSWLVDCECGAGNATDPDWGMALCFGCGAVHDRVVFPAGDVADITTLLVARKDMRKRAWNPGEPVTNLIRENVDVGAGVEQDVVDAAAGVEGIR